MNRQMARVPSAAAIAEYNERNGTFDNALG